MKITLTLILVALFTSLSHAENKSMRPEFQNPVIFQRADPFIFRHTDGYYYFTASVPEYDRIVLRRAKTIEELAKAEEKTIWRKHSKGEMGAHIWAPEIHFIDGKWYIYFAAGAVENVWAIRPYVLENESANPLQGTWKEKGRIKTNFESFSLDATTFVHRGTRYLCWAQHNPELKNNTSLYIAKMDTPWSIVGKQIQISHPDLEWEQRLYKVNEGPAFITHGDKVFIAYSASGTDFNYCMGLLTATADADLLDPKSWTKSPEPVFKTSDENGIFGPGHNCFTTTPDGKTDLNVYHARSYKQIKGDPLYDPNRHTRVQPVEWDENGMPIFGIPEKDRNPKVKDYVR